MQCITIRQALYRYQFLAIKRRQKLDTGVDRFEAYVVTSAIQFRDNNRTRAAISFGAAFFRSLAPQILAQKLQYSSGRVYVSNFDDFAIEQESNRSVITHVSQLPR
jgi:hypothetical protein